MLIIERRKGERVLLREKADGTPVWLEVMEVRGGKVRLGITAPSSVAIVREELVTEGMDLNRFPPMPAPKTLLNTDEQEGE